MTVKNLLKYLLYGILWGCTFFVVANVVIIMVTGNAQALEANNFLMGALASVVAGIGGGGMSIVYTIEKWSFKKQVALHFAVGISAYLLAAYIGGWFVFTFDLIFFLAVLGSIAIFFLIWLVFYLINKAEAKAINGKIKDFQNENSEKTGSLE